MPFFDLRYIKVAKYHNDNGQTSYTDGTSIGDAISVNLSLRRAEGRLYAESTLAEFLSKVTGGTISIAEKYIKTPAQKLMYGAREAKRTVNGSEVTGLKYGAKDKGQSVGVACYAPDMIEGEEKYTAFLVKRARFGQPDIVLQTQNENITFQTPTTSGEFMPDHSEDQDYLEVVTVDDEETAKAWVDLVLNIKGGSQTEQTAGGRLVGGEANILSANAEAPAKANADENQTVETTEEQA